MDVVEESENTIDEDKEGSAKTLEGVEDEDPGFTDETVLADTAAEMGEEPDAVVLDPTTTEDPDEPLEPETAGGGAGGRPES